MLAKTTDQSALKLDHLQLDSARVDLAAAQAKLQVIQQNELAATDTAASFQVWRNQRDAALSEVDRLTKVVDRLEAIAAERFRREQLAVLQKRVDAQRQANEALA